MHDLSNAKRVVITDINMKFSAMVVFIIKWTLAAIPAIIIMSLIMGAISLLFTLLLGGMVSLF
ncbi:MAG: hypothetical protein AAF614_06900 [Chloroflexota bacterium]